MKRFARSTYPPCPPCPNPFIIIYYIIILYIYIYGVTGDKNIFLNLGTSRPHLGTGKTHLGTPK